MRITRGMMVNNMLYWTEQQMDRLNDASTVVASGKRINRPSDNPAATGEILADRATLSSHGQYESNISRAETWIETSSTTIEVVGSLLTESQEVISSLATADEAATMGYLQSLESIYDQMLELANSKYGAGYMYGGKASDKAPFSSVSMAGGAPEDIYFDLLSDASDLTVQVTITNSAGKTVREIEETGVNGEEGTNSLSWDGKDGDGNVLPDGDYEFTVTVTDNLGKSVASYASYRGDDQGKTVMIGKGDTITLNNNGGKIFSDTLSYLSQAITAIKNSEDATSLEDAYSEAIATIEAEQVSLANAKTQLQYKNDWLERLDTTATNRISDRETGSTEEAAIKLQAQKISYDITLEAVASVLKMTKLTDLI